MTSGRMVSLIAVGTCVLAIMLLVLVWMTAYSQSKALSDSQRAGCARAVLDREANARGWRAAEAAREASGTRTDLEAARRYDVIADGLEQRARIDCVAEFPPPSLFDLR